MKELRVAKSPELWPQYPYLRVERRTEERPGQPACFLRVTERQEVEPKVFMTQQWPPPDDDEVSIDVLLDYDNLDTLLAQGWRPRLPNWLRIS